MSFSSIFEIVGSREGINENKLCHLKISRNICVEPDHSVVKYTVIWHRVLTQIIDDDDDDNICYM